jgi:CHAD domain-containing protein
VAVRLPSGLSEVAVFRRIALANLAQLQANEAGLAGPQADVEYVHQARVALRRLRSAMDLFGDALPKAWVQKWKPFWQAQARCLGAARDGDVLCTDWLPRLTAVLAADPAVSGSPHLAWLGTLAQTRRESAHTALRQQVTNPEHHRQLKAFRRGVRRLSVRAKDAPLSQRWVRKHLQRLHDKAVRASEQVPGMLDIAEMADVVAVAERVDIAAEPRHELRIRLKRLRYALDMVSSLLPPRRVARYQRTLGELQDRLGQLNDLATVRRLLSDGPAEVHALLLPWLSQQEADLLGPLPRMVADWRRRPEPWQRRH